MSQTHSPTTSIARLAIDARKTVMDMLQSGYVPNIGEIQIKINEDNDVTVIASMTLELYSSSLAYSREEEREH